MPSQETRSVELTDEQIAFLNWFFSDCEVGLWVEDYTKGNEDQEHRLGKIYTIFQNAGREV